MGTLADQLRAIRELQERPEHQDPGMIVSMRWRLIEQERDLLRARVNELEALLPAAD